MPNLYYNCKRDPDGILDRIIIMSCISSLQNQQRSFSSLVRNGFEGGVGYGIGMNMKMIMKMNMIMNMNMKMNMTLKKMNRKNMGVGMGRKFSKWIR